MTNKKQTPAGWEKDFDLLWGIAPKGTLKYLKHKNIKDFIAQLLTQRETDDKDALKTIENQLYAINARNISLHWIGMRKTPTPEEISELNELLGFIIAEIRSLRETGRLDVDKVHEECFGKI